jgi:hypothetical protein
MLNHAESSNDKETYYSKIIAYINQGNPETGKPVLNDTLLEYSVIRYAQDHKSVRQDTIDKWNEGLRSRGADLIEYDKLFH